LKLVPFESIGAVSYLESFIHHKMIAMKNEKNEKLESNKTIRLP